MTTANLTITDNDTVIQYTSIGESAFLYDFPILSTDELKVSINQVDKQIGIDYTVSGVGNAGGGTVTFLVATTTGEVITLWQEMPFKRVTGFATGAAVLAGEALNTEFARQVRHDQQVRRDIGRAIRLEPDDPQSGQDMTLPTKTTRAGKFLAFDSAGKPTVSNGSGDGDVSLRTDLASQLASQGFNLVAITPNTSEVARGSVIINPQYGHGTVDRFGVARDGATDDGPEIQAVVDSLSTTEGGIVFINEGRYSIQTAVQILGTTFINGGVKILMHPRAVLEVEGSATAAFEFIGASTALPMSHCMVEGGRIVGVTDGAAQGLLFRNCAHWRVVNTSITGFNSTLRSTRAGIFAQYAIWGLIDRPTIDNCDYGINIEGDAADAFRGTTCTILGGSVRTCWRGIRFEDGFGHVIFRTAVENSSIGIDLDFSRTSINSAAIELHPYFERNGRHLRIRSEGTGRARGIHLTDSLLELVHTTYISGTAFEDTGSGLVKVQVDGDYCELSANYWSSSVTATLTGAHDGSNNAAVLTDSGESWDVNALIGMKITNNTDGSEAIITANTATTITGVLAGGTENDWDASDTYTISGADIIIKSSAVSTMIRKQLREPGGFTILDAASDTRYEAGSYTPFAAITDADATPSVRGGKSFLTGNTGATTITDLDDGFIDDIPWVIRFGDSQTTVDFTGTNLRGNAGVDWSPNTNDFMVCRKVTSTVWLCEVHET